MRVVVQRVARAMVHVDGMAKATIGNGLLVLLGIEQGDGPEDLEWVCGKLVRLRVFPNSDGAMDLDITQARGELLLVSQFTLHASTRKGNRPGFFRAAGPDEAMPIYLRTRERLTQLLHRPVASGEFGAHMLVESINDGPVTIIIDSKLRE